MEKRFYEKDEMKDICSQRICERRPDWIFDWKRIRKNNGIILNGLAVVCKGKDRKIACPTIYLENFFDFNKDYSNEEVNHKIDDMINILSGDYGSNVIESLNIENIMAFDQMQNCLRLTLINTELNRELLDDIPHRKFLDLSVVYYLALSSDDNNFMTTKVTNSLMDSWGVNESILFDMALERTMQTMPASFMSMQKILFDLAGIETTNNETVSDAGNEMYVLSNQQKTNGAAVVMYPGLLKEIAKKMGVEAFVFAISSIHEVVIFPASATGDTEYLEEMVEEINRTEVSTQEVMSNSIYKYDVLTDKISII